MGKGTDGRRFSIWNTITEALDGGRRELTGNAPKTEEGEEEEEEEGGEMDSGGLSLVLAPWGAAQVTTTRDGGLLGVHIVLRRTM